MSGILAQLGMLAQRPNLEDWTDLLVVAAMAVLWLAGGLVKALSNKRKSSPQDEQARTARQPVRPPRESWQVRLARKAEEMQRTIGQRGRPRSTPAPVARPPQPPGGRITIRQGPMGESIMVYERAAPPAVPPAQQEPQTVRRSQAEEAVAAAGRAIAKEPAPVEPKLEIKSPVLEPIAEGLPDVGIEAPQPSESDSQKTVVAQESGGLSAVLLDSSDALRRAILHYEILGVPLGLREPFE